MAQAYPSTEKGSLEDYRDILDTGYTGSWRPVLFITFGLESPISVSVGKILKW